MKFIEVNPGIQSQFTDLVQANPAAAYVVGVVLLLIATHWLKDSF